MGLRKGKWTLEEEKYANKIILSFNQGLLSVMPGTTLRSYLSGKLNWYVWTALRSVISPLGVVVVSSEGVFVSN